MMRATPAEKPPNERVVPQLAEMKEALASECPADNEIEQNAEHWKLGVALFDAIQFLQSLTELDFFEIFQKDFASSDACGVLLSVLILLMGVINFT